MSGADSAHVRVLEQELGRLQNAVAHLVQSNAELKEAIQAEGDDEDRTYKTAIEARGSRGVPLSPAGLAPPAALAALSRCRSRSAPRPHKLPPCPAHPHPGLSRAGQHRDDRQVSGPG